jgi:hypothetical protein
MAEDRPPRLAIVHVDEVPWTEVIAQQHGDRRVSVHEKFLEWTDKMMVVLGRYDPGMIIERHGHRSDHLIFVLEGELTVGDPAGDRVCGPHTLIVLEEGAVFGPLIAGDQGALLYESWAGDPLPNPADKEGYYALLESRGVVRLPNPTFTPPPSAPSHANDGSADAFS